MPSISFIISILPKISWFTFIRSFYIALSSYIYSRMMLIFGYIMSIVSFICDCASLNYGNSLLNNWLFIFWWSCCFVLVFSYNSLKVMSLKYVISAYLPLFIIDWHSIIIRNRFVSLLFCDNEYFSILWLFICYTRSANVFGNSSCLSREQNWFSSFLMITS